MRPTPAAEDRRDPGVDGRHVHRQLAQGVADEGSSVVCLHADEPHPSLGEIEHLQRAGGLDEPLDVLGDELLGADGEIDGERVPREELAVLEVLGGAHPRDLRRGAEHGVGDLARHHVRLVAAGHRQHEVGVLGPRVGEDVGMGGMPADGADVEVVLERAQPPGIDVDHRDVVGLARQGLRHGGADLSGAEDDDLHGGSPIRRPGQSPLPAADSFGSIPSPRSLR